MVGKKAGWWSAFLLYLFIALGACSFTTAGAAAAACPNEANRVGPSANLPDCRAYELVTPPDTNGRRLSPVEQDHGQFPFELASPVRPSFVFEAADGALVTPGGGSGVHDVYRAEREGAGWRTAERISRSADTTDYTHPGGIAADHQYSFTAERNVTYLRKPDGSFELVGLGTVANEPYAEGRYISDGGGHVIFSTGTRQDSQSAPCHYHEVHFGNCPVTKLTSDAPPEGTGAIYDRPADGQARVISLLPDDETPNAGEEAFYKGCSRDAGSVAFSVGDSLYVRVKVGSEGEEETLKVAEGSPVPVYAGLSTTGRYLFYIVGGDKGTIHRFDTETKEDVAVNPTGEGEVVNISADGSHVYFVSEQQLDGGKGTVGQPNMYVWSAGSTEYITTVAQSDLQQTSGVLNGLPGLAHWTTPPVVSAEPSGTLQNPGADSSRTTPDGQFLIFESRAQLLTYDNGDRTEIYRYDAVERELSCVSCNHAVAQPAHDAQLQALDRLRATVVLHNLSEDGKRVFFETEEALVPEDINGINDVYEWHEEAGAGSVALISSGRSGANPGPQTSNLTPHPNVLFSITPSGADVFFSAPEDLVPGAGENGTQAIYDARVDGGFAAPLVPDPCREEGCKGSTVLGGDIFPGSQSEAVTGSGNVKAPKPRKHRCHRSKKHPKRCSKRQRRSRSARRSSAAPRAAEDSGAAPAAPQASAASANDEGVNQQSPAAALPGTVGTPEEFGIQRWVAELSSREPLVPGEVPPPDQVAGDHPNFRTLLEFNHFQIEGEEEATAALEEVAIDLPPGLIGNPKAVPTCSTGDFVAEGDCSPDSQVGVTRVTLGEPLHGTISEPVYNLTPPHPDKELARLGFIAGIYPTFIDIKVDTAHDYHLVASINRPSGAGVVVRAKTVIWGNPANAAHDEQRLTVSEANDCPKGNACKAESEGVKGRRASGIPPADRRAFLASPSACQGGDVGLKVTSYQLPGQVFTASAPLAPITDCTGLPFAPSFEADPTSHEAGAPTGLKTRLVLPQHLGEAERATATMREARVTLPEGMQVAAGAANWIGTCSEAQVGYHEEVDTNCPDNSKLGTVTIISPALSIPIEGTIYQRSPEPGHQLGLWLTADALGLHIKLPGSLEPDKNTGRLTAVFTDLPQVPVEEIDLDVWGGPRAPLQNPDHCGTFTTDFSFSPHSNDPAATGQSTMQITEGCNQPFNPTLHAGVTDPVAGKFSPFVFDLTRPDGNQALRGFSLHLPEGAIGKPKGVPLCSDADAEAAGCPQGSRIGSIQATTGPGPEPFTLPEAGRPQPQIYLAGPYKGAPFSIVSEVPAQAGPFDLGTLAVRSGLEVEPETGKAVVEADPLPQFFEGVGIAYRHLHAVVDRPEFFLNPTDCREMAVTSDVTSTQGVVAHPQARFQVDGCKALKFKPKLSLKLKGGTKRAQYPALTAVLKARKGDANIAYTSVALPHSEFIAQEHFVTICTRVQFAADKCPKGSIYGKAKATTPLLDKPLSGPVYLRSSDHPLPDLVVKLGGELEIVLVGHVDSVNGGLRTRFESVPDAPVTRFTLQMRGGRKGLFVNSTDICRRPQMASVQMRAQNGRVVNSRTRLQAGGCGRKKLGKNKHHH